MATDPRPHAGDFATALAKADRGNLLDTLDDELREVVDGVALTGKTGKIVLTVTITTPRAESGMIEISAASKKTVPKLPTLGAIFYDNGSRLLGQDPNQLRLEGLREADEPARPAPRDA